MRTIANDKWRKFSAAIGNYVKHQISVQMEPKAFMNNLFNPPESEESKRFFSRKITAQPKKSYFQFRQGTQR